MLDLPAAYSDMLKKLVPTTIVHLATSRGVVTLNAQLVLNHVREFDHELLDLRDQNKIKNIVNEMARATAAEMRRKLEEMIVKIDTNLAGVGSADEGNARPLRGEGGQ